MNTIIIWFKSLVAKITAKLTAIWSDAQMAHFAWGAWLLLCYPVLHKPYWEGLVSVLGFAAFKEFVLEYLLTHADPTIKHSLMDFLGWLAGVGMASLIILLGH